MRVYFFLFSPVIPSLTSHLSPRIHNLYLSWCEEWPPTPRVESSFAADLSSCDYNQNMGRLQKYLDHTFTAWEVLISAVN